MGKGYIGTICLGLLTLPVVSSVGPVKWQPRGLLACLFPPSYLVFYEPRIISLKVTALCPSCQTTGSWWGSHTISPGEAGSAVVSPAVSLGLGVLPFILGWHCCLHQHI